MRRESLSATSLLGFSPGMADFAEREAHDTIEILAEPMRYA